MSQPWRAGDADALLLAVLLELLRRHPGEVLAVMREDLLRLGRGWFGR
jgi:hypothetical protein